MSTHEDEGPHGVEIKKRGPQRRCSLPLIQFRNQFVYLAQDLAKIETGIDCTFQADRIMASWLSHALAENVGSANEKWSVIETLGAWIEWVIEHVKDRNKKRVASFSACRDRGRRWRPEIRLWLERHRSLWAEATLAAEVYCERVPRDPHFAEEIENG